MRKAEKKRITKETKIHACINIDGEGKAEIDTGIGFFDHMLTLLAFHSKMDILLKANGDVHVCDHHTIEDCGILLGDCIFEALGDKRGIHRYGSMNLAMDETLANVTLDISGRSFLVFHCDLKRERIGAMSCEMVEEFFRAVAMHARLCVHVNVYYGQNDHHKVEAIFKAFAHALKEAVAITSDVLPSSKGLL